MLGLFRMGILMEATLSKKRMTGSEVRKAFLESRRKYSEIPRPPLTKEMIRKQQETYPGFRSSPGQPG